MNPIALAVACLLAPAGPAPSPGAGTTVAGGPPEPPLPHPRVVSATTIPFPVVVPYRAVDGCIVISAVVGGGDPVDAVLSTGLSLSLAAPRAQRVTPQPDAPPRSVNLLDSPVTVPYGGARALRIGPLSLDDVPFGVFDVPAYLSTRDASLQPGVWIGNTAMEGLTVTIDPWRGMVIFDRPDAPLPKGAIVVPFEIVAGRLVVRAKANRKQAFDAIADVSMPGTIIPARVAKALKLRYEESPAVLRPGGPESKVAFAELSGLSCGGLSVTAVPVLFVAADAPAGVDKDFAVIGGDVLLRQPITIQYSTRKLAFARPPKAPAGAAVPPLAPPPGSGHRTQERRDGP